MTDKLLPCPFCGKHPKIIGSGDLGYWIKCTYCGVETDGSTLKTYAISAWNTLFENKEIDK